MYSDGVTKKQCSIVIQGKRYGKVYLSEAAAQRVMFHLSYVEDENGGCYQSPIDYSVKKVEPHDFKTYRQCISRIRKVRGRTTDQVNRLRSHS